MTDTGKNGNIIAVPKSILPLPSIFNTPYFTETDITNFLTNCRDNLANAMTNLANAMTSLANIVTNLVNVVGLGSR